jgi:hypothetical protein
MDEVENTKLVKISEKITDIKSKASELEDTDFEI